MKKPKQTKAALSPTKAASCAPAAVARPSKSKVGDADASPAKSETVAPETDSPSAMDLLRITRWFGLITPTSWDINDENILAKMNGLAELEKDEEFCRHLEEAARLYQLAEAVAHKTRQASPKPDTKVIRRNLLRIDQLRRIWEYASQPSERNKYLPNDEAMRSLHFKTEDSFRQFLRTLFYPFYRSSVISVDVIRILKILQTEQSRKRDAERKRLRRASTRKNNGQSASPRQAPKVDPDIFYSDLLKSLKMAFQQAGVQVDASLF